MLDLSLWSAAQIAHAVRQRELSPVEVIETTLRRIATVNPQLNAFIALRAEEALAEARALEARLARREEVGTLAGVPFGVKDEEDLAGLPTTLGSVPFRDNVARADSTQVARLRRAGAIPVGKTNMPEFGYTCFTRNRLFGTTRNPWDVSRTPGGSSGGSAAAVAAGMVPLGTGFDGGGSVRIPACYTGLVGMKPTFGRISRGPFAFRDWIDTISPGPLARSVMDSALYLDAVAGYDPHDPDSLSDQGTSYAAHLDESPRGLRLGFSPTLGYARVDAEVAEIVARAVTTLGQALEVSVRDLTQRFTDTGIAWVMLNAFQINARLGHLVEQHRDEWDRGFLAGLELGARVGAAEIGGAQADRQRLIGELVELFEQVDVLLTPTLPTVAFDAEGPLPTGTGSEPFESPLHAVAFTYPFNMTGHPAVSLRAGLTAAGLPVGLQLVAERGREDLLFRVARVFEQACPAREWPTEPRGTAA